MEGARAVLVNVQLVPLAAHERHAGRAHSKASTPLDELVATHCSILPAPDTKTPPEGSACHNGVLMRKIDTVSGHIGYRHQLDRARRFLDRMGAEYHSNVDFQDIAWSFFQHCWHIKDWLKNDPLVPEDTKAAVIQRAHSSHALQACRELRNGTKHLVPVGARHLHTTTTVFVDRAEVDHDCVIDDGRGAQWTGRAFAKLCVAEWETILSDEGLAIARLS
jgi:hypothetical protein